MSRLKAQSHNLNVKTNIKFRAYSFSLLIIKFVGKLPNNRIYWVIGDQLLRSVTSRGANIVEAKPASSKREFVKYYEIALKSANEVKYWLCLLRDFDLEGVDKVKVKELLEEAIELSNMIG